MKPTKILVAGGAGFVGSHLVEKLLENGHIVAVYDSYLNFSENLSYYKYALKYRKKIFKRRPQKIYKADIRHKRKLTQAFREFNPEIVVNLAALPLSRPTKKHQGKMVPINLLGTLNILDAFERHPTARKIIYTSSSMSYGFFLDDFQKEETILNPMNQYGATKASGEHFVKLSKKEWTIVRPVCVYGFTDCANRVTQILLDRAITGKPAWIVKGEKLDLTYIDDAVDGYIRIIESDNSSFDTFNIAYGKAVSVKYFAELIKKYYPDFEFEIKDPLMGRVNTGGLDISKAKQILGYNPKYPIEKGLDKVLKLMRKHGWIKEVYNQE